MSSVIVRLSVAISLDGYIGSTFIPKVPISSPEDYEAVYKERDDYDAILVGANTIRLDNPKLATYSGRSLLKVTASKTGLISQSFTFFSEGRSLIFLPSSLPVKIKRSFERVSTVVYYCGEQVGIVEILDALGKLGVNSLFVEGGGAILTQFISSGYYHSLRLAIAPLFLQGCSGAKKMVTFSKLLSNRLHVQSRQFYGDTTVLELVP